jgi:hypothetical protein
MRDCHFELVKDLRARMPRGEADRLLHSMVVAIKEAARSVRSDQSNGQACVTTDKNDK